MKKLFKMLTTMLIVACLISNVFILQTQAATFQGSSVLDFNSKQSLKIGATITIKAVFSSKVNMEILQGYFLYDPTVLEYVGGNANCNEITKGKIKIWTDNTSSQKTHTEALKFKAIAVGESKLSLEDIKFWTMEEQQYLLEGASGVKVTVVSSSTQASSNANLKSLIVSSGTLTPKFDPNVTEYSITLKNDITELWVSTTKADAKATVNVEGSKDMKVGVNKRVVVVTAENGTTKRYTLNITRLAADGQQPVTPPTENDEPLNDLIEVNVGEETMYIVEDFANTELPKGFDITEYAFNGKMVPALTADNYIILMLRLPDNSKKAFYIYNDDGVFSELIGLSIGGQTYYILPTDKVPDGYSAVNDFTIGDIVVPAFRNDEAGFEDFAVVYAMGPTGITSYYSYDTVENTIQRISGVSVNVETKPSIGTTTPGEEEEEKDILQPVQITSLLLTQTAKSLLSQFSQLSYSL